MPDTNETEDSTLPRPELNPLLNPLLASHMGRWAEVYFTNPPEKREEAVLELLRELESSADATTDATQPLQEKVEQTEQEETKQADLRITEATPPYDAEPSVCSECGHLSRSGQRFCGMCGTPLTAVPFAANAEILPVPEAFQTAESANRIFTAGPELVSPAAQEMVEENGGSLENTQSSSPAPPPHAVPLPRRREPMWPRSTPDLPGFALQPEALPDRRRLYVAVGIAALLCFLVYLGWRTGRSSGPETQEINLPSSPAAIPPSQSTPASHAAPAPAATNNGASATAIKPIAVSRQVGPREAHSHGSPSPAASAHAPSPGENGTADLAMAQKYLYGTGEARDTNQAVKWLWKAIGKQNMTAMLLLSDLYLRGDGVPRSCDQARLLLDAAARKGKAEAAERLQHLQAFGCQ